MVPQGNRKDSRERNFENEDRAGNEEDGDINGFHEKNYITMLSIIKDLEINVQTWKPVSEFL
jgi:hypothetical protein